MIMIIHSATQQKKSMVKIYKTIGIVVLIFKMHGMVVVLLKLKEIYNNRKVFLLNCIKYKYYHMEICQPVLI